MPATPVRRCPRRFRECAIRALPADVARPLQRGCDGSEPLAGEEAVAIELIEQVRADAGEQDLHGVLFTSQNNSQLSAVSFAKKCLGKMSGMLLNVVAAKLSRQNPPPQQNQAPAPTRFLFREQTVPHKARHQSLESPPHRRRHPQCVRVKRNTWSHSHLPQPARELRGRQIVNVANRRLKFGTATNANDRSSAFWVAACNCSSGSGANAGLTTRQASAPRRHDTSNRVCPLARKAARARNADRPETIHQHAWFSRLVIERDVAFQEIITEFLHPCAHTAGCAR